MLLLAVIHLYIYIMETNYLNTADAIFYVINLSADMYNDDTADPDNEDFAVSMFVRRYICTCICSMIRRADKQSWDRDELRQILKKAYDANDQRFNELCAITETYLEIGNHEQSAEFGNELPREPKPKQNRRIR